MLLCDVSYLYITHDLAVARYMCDRIAVMYNGKIVELANTEELLKNPIHTYTKRLISSIPVSLSCSTCSVYGFSSFFFSSI